MGIGIFALRWAVRMKEAVAVAVFVCSMLVLLTMHFIGVQAFCYQDRVMAVLVLVVVYLRAWRRK